MKRKQWGKACLLALLALLAMGGMGEVAAEADDALWHRPVESLFEADRSELASRFRQRRIEAPGITQVITRQDIRDFGYQTLAEALRALPGTFTTDDHLYSWLGIRGLQRPGDYNTRILLLVDGVRINDAMLEQAYLGNEFLIDISLVERIEFTAGPGSSVYGSNAAIGVINVITVDPGADTGGRVEAVAGGNGRRRLAASATGTSAGGVGWLASVAGLHDDGLGARDWDRAEKAFMKFKGADWRVTGAVMQRTRVSPYGPWNTQAGDSRFRSTDTQGFVSGTWRQDLAPGLSANAHLTLSRQIYRGAFPTGFGTPGTVVMNRDHLWADRASGELRFEDRRFAGHVWVYGLAAEAARVRLDNTNDPALAPDVFEHQRGRQAGFYVQDEFTAGDWRFNLGGRYDRYSSFGGTFNPRFAASYAVGGGHYLKAMAGTAYRAPSHYEMHYRNNIIGYEENSDLKPEKVRTLELAWEHEGPQGGASASVFRHQVRHLIEPPGAGANPSQTQYQNTRDATITGAQVAAEGWLGSLRLRGSLARQRVEYTGGETLANAPTWIAKFAASLPLLQGTLSTEWLGLSHRHTLTDTAGNDFGTSPGYGRLDLAYRHRFGTRGHEWFLGVLNVFNRRYDDPVGVEYVRNSADAIHANQALGRLPQPGRVWRLGLSLAY